MGAREQRPNTQGQTRRARDTSRCSWPSTGLRLSSPVAPIYPANQQVLKQAQSLPTVTRVIDGDTVVVEGIGTVRLIGVDTPETVDPRRPVQYFGKEASDFTKQLATGKRVRLEFDQDRTDRYGRTLAYVYLQPENLLLNAEIIRQGYGFAYTQFPFRMMEHFRALEREAREAGRGLWARSIGFSPRDHGPRRFETPEADRIGSAVGAPIRQRHDRRNFS